MSSSPEFSNLVADIKERVLYLQEMGVDSLEVDLKALKLPNQANVENVQESPPPVHLTQMPPVPPLTPETRKPFQSRLSTLPSLSARPMQPPRPNSREQKEGTELFGKVLPVLPEPVETIEQIRADIGISCTRCKLHTLGRKQVVNSTGHFDADLMFVGEAPGADEDVQGEPFVGRAGQLLTKIIEGIGLRREDVFIGNINRCRPPGNRAPEADETIVCKPFLLREIAVVRPRVIVVLGATAAQNLLETKVPIGRLRGHFHDYMGVKVMPTFHPAYLLRDPHKKREVWEDMKMVRDYLTQV